MIKKAGGHLFTSQFYPNSNTPRILLSDEPHFFPFSDYQFISPISYWDPAHFGLWISALEVALMVMGSTYLLRHSESTAQTRWVRGLLAIYLLFFAMAVVWWVSSAG